MLLGQLHAVLLQGLGLALQPGLQGHLLLLEGRLPAQTLLGVQLGQLGKLSLDPQALLILDDEVLLSLLQLLQLILRVLRDQSQLLKGLVDLKVFLGHGISETSSWRSTIVGFSDQPLFVVQNMADAADQLHGAAVIRVLELRGVVPQLDLQ